MVVIVVKQTSAGQYADDWPSLVEEFHDGEPRRAGQHLLRLVPQPKDPNLWVLVEVFRDAEAGEAHVRVGALQGGGRPARRPPGTACSPCATFALVPNQTFMRRKHHSHHDGARCPGEGRRRGCPTTTTRAAPDLKVRGVVA